MNVATIHLSFSNSHEHSTSNSQLLYYKAQTIQNSFIVNRETNIYLMAFLIHFRILSYFPYLYTSKTNSWFFNQHALVRVSHPLILYFLFSVEIKIYYF